MAPRLRSASALHNVLPEEALRVIWLLLPVDARARAACVCRAWRAFLSDTSLWQVLDLTPAGGVAEARVTENLVRGAVRRAAGHLRVFSMNRAPDLHALVVEVVVSDGAGLEEFTTGVRLSIDDLRTVFAAAPRLRVLNTHVLDECTELLPLLRNSPPYGPLRVSTLGVSFRGDEGAAEFDALAAAMAAHEPLKSIWVRDEAYSRGVNALMDTAAVQRVARFRLHDCDLDDESVPALARLLSRGSLTSLEFSCELFAPGPEAALELWAALRSCRTLTHLRLQINAPTGENRRDILELIDSAASLPDLAVLDLSYGEVEDNAATGHALAALLRANRPSFRGLYLSYCTLDDEGMGLVLDGLAANTHLRELYCDGNDLSDELWRDRVEPALAALAARAQRDA